MKSDHLNLASVFLPTVKLSFSGGVMLLACQGSRDLKFGVAVLKLSFQDSRLKFGVTVLKLSFQLIKTVT